MKKLVLILMGGMLQSCGEQPTADFSWSPETPRVNQEVTFVNTSVDANRYDWNLGNMTISRETNPSNTYTSPGDYIVDLTARNGLRSDVKTVVITVTP